MNSGRTPAPGRVGTPLPRWDRQRLTSRMNGRKLPNDNERLSRCLRPGGSKRRVWPMAGSGAYKYLVDLVCEGAGVNGIGLAGPSGLKERRN
jgi:hypothetical protein